MGDRDRRRAETLDAVDDEIVEVITCLGVGKLFSAVAGERLPIQEKRSRLD